MATYNQDDLRTITKNNTNTIIFSEPIVIATDNRSCIYMSFETIDNQQESDITTEVGTVTSIDYEMYPTFTSLDLLISPIDTMIGSMSFVEQGSDGGWSSGPSVTPPALDCPLDSAIDIIRSTDLNTFLTPSNIAQDSSFSNFDSVPSDNTSRLFVSEGDAYNVFCKYNVSLLPALSRTNGANIGGSSRFRPNLHPSIPNTPVPFPSMNYSFNRNAQSEVTSISKERLFVYINDLGSLEVNPQSQGYVGVRFIFDNIQTIPNFSLLSDPNYVGNFSFPFISNGYYSTPKSISTVTITNTIQTLNHSNPTTVSPAPTTSVTTQLDTDQETYITNSILNRKIFLVPGNVRFEGIVTSVTVTNTINNFGFPSGSTLRNGLTMPSTDTLTAFSVNITGSTPIKNNIIRANNQSIQNFVYFPYVEHVNSSAVKNLLDNATMITRPLSDIQNDPDQLTTVLATMTAQDFGVVNNDSLENSMLFYEIRRRDIPGFPNSAEIVQVNMNAQQCTIEPSILDPLDYYLFDDVVQWPVLATVDEMI